MPIQKIRTFLWFDDAAEDAARLYVSLFKDSSITKITRYGNAGPGAPGSVMIVEFVLAGIQFVALNGGPHFKFTEAISLTVDCESQEEIDHLWEKLCEGGSESQCGWLKDKYGLSWQIVPSALGQLMGGGDPARSGRVAQAMFKMRKLDIATLKKAYDGESGS